MTGHEAASGAPWPIAGCMTYAIRARGMFDHLHAVHQYDAHAANETVAVLAESAAWGSVTTFIPKRPRGSAGSAGNRPTAKGTSGIKPRPASPPQETWEELVDYLIEIGHIIHKDRHIPKYQFERHVDSLLVPFLPENLAAWWSSVQHGRVVQRPETESALQQQPKALGETALLVVGAGHFSLSGSAESSRSVASEFPLKKLETTSPPTPTPSSTRAVLSTRQTLVALELKTDPHSVSAARSSRTHEPASGGCRTWSTTSRRWPGQAAQDRSTRLSAAS